MRILVADDSEAIVTSLSSVFKQWGHEVLSASDGAEGWAKLQQNDIDLAVLDWMMPKMDGLELCRKIRQAELPRYVFIILMTGRDQREDFTAALEAGADEFIQKPFNLGEFRARLRAIARLQKVELDLKEQSRELAVAHAEARRQLQNLEALFKVSEAMHSQIHLDILLQVILTATTQVMNAERSSLFIHDELRDELWSKIAEGLDSEEIRFPLGVGIAGDVAKTRAVANIPDAYQDPRFNPEFDRSTGYHTRGILCLPMVQPEGKLIGVIQVLNKKDGGTFDREDENLLSALAAHAAIALDRAQLVEAYAEKRRIEATLKLAHQIQMGILPTRFPPFPDRQEFEIFALSEPAKEVGGDFYDFFLIDKKKLGFVIGDVSGKGIPAALLMARTMALVRATAQRGLSPGPTLSWVNNQLSQENETCTFVTIVCGVLDTDTGTVKYSNGGHNLPYLLTGRKSIRPLTKVHGMPLGILENSKYLETSVRMKTGDVLFLYTDGITEAMDPHRNEFSEGRLKATLELSINAPVAEIIGAVVRDVKAFSVSAPQADDMTALALRYIKPGG